MKNVLMTILLLLFFFQTYGQISTDNKDSSLTIEFSSNTHFNDSLLSRVPTNKFSKEVTIIIDSITYSSELMIDFAFFQKSRTVKIIGGQIKELTFSNNGKKLHLNKLIILSKVDNLVFKDKLNSLDTLIIYNAGLTEIPVSINKCKNVSFLDLSHNKIKNIGNRLCNLEKLEYLIMTDNILTRIPASIEYNKKLVALNFESNIIKDIAKEISKLKHLGVINLMGNKDVEIPTKLRDKKEIKIYGM